MGLDTERQDHRPCTGRNMTDMKTRTEATKAAGAMRCAQASNQYDSLTVADSDRATAAYVSFS